VAEHLILISNLCIVLFYRDAFVACSVCMTACTRTGLNYSYTCNSPKTDNRENKQNIENKQK